MEKSDPSPLLLTVYETVREIQDIKRDNGQVPDFATRDEIFNSLKAEIMESLRGLYRKGLIEFHPTVNGIPMFGIKEN